MQRRSGRAKVGRTSKISGNVLVRTSEPALRAAPGPRTGPARSPPDGVPTPSRGLPAPPRDPHAVGRQRRLRARQQRRVLRLLRHRHQPLADRRGRPGHPRGAGDRRLRRVALHATTGGLAFPEDVEAGLRVGKLGNSSVRYEIGLFGTGAQEAAADGWFVHVFVDRGLAPPGAACPEAARRLDAAGAPGMRTRAAVLREMGSRAPTPSRGRSRSSSSSSTTPGPGELLVRVRAAGLCHSDLSVIDGSRPRRDADGARPRGCRRGRGRRRRRRRLRPRRPRRAGVRPGVRGLRALPRRASPRSASRARPPTPPASCSGGGRRLRTADGEPLHHHLGVSAFAEHAVVSARSAVRVDPELPFELAALFGCAVLTGVGAAIHSAAVAPGDRVAVFGLGGVGLAALLGAVVAGASTIVAIDVVAGEARPRPGARRDPRGPGRAGRRRGGPRAHRRRGRPGRSRPSATSACSPRPTPRPAAAGRRSRSACRTRAGCSSIPAVSLVAEERTLRGSYLGSCVPARDIPRVHRPLRPGPPARRPAAHPPARARRPQRGLRPPGPRRGRAPGRRALSVALRARSARPARARPCRCRRARSRAGPRRPCVP